jgi:sulfiredoxin
MLKRENFPVANIYVPIKRRLTLDQSRVDALAASMLKDGQQTPILVRPDGARFVLVEGLHRLEAAKALGEATIVGFRVDARKH